MSREAALEIALTSAVRELREAEDKFHVIFCNHPGKAVSKYQEEDKQFCAATSDRMGNAAKDAQAVLSGKTPALLAFIEQMARMTTPEDEFAAEGKEGDELRARYDDADDYRADLDDDRLCGEFDAFMMMIAEARKLLT